MCLYKCESVIEWLQRAKETTEEFREFKEDLRSREARDRRAEAGTEAEARLFLFPCQPHSWLPYFLRYVFKNLHKDPQVRV